MPRIFDNIELKLFPALCETLQVPPAWKGALDDGRLRLFSPFEEQYRRATTALAIRRNRFVADVADEVFIAHAAPGGKTEQFCRKLVAEGRSVFVFDRKENQHLLESGARKLDPSQVLSGSRPTGRTPQSQRMPRKT